eukprot:15436693-Alexandrium_andersonii.AAC.1
MQVAAPSLAAFPVQRVARRSLARSLVPGAALPRSVPSLARLSRRSSPSIARSLASLRRIRSLARLPPRFTNSLASSQPRSLVHSSLPMPRLSGFFSLLTH